MGRWQGDYFRCGDCCDTVIGKFTRDQETGDKVPVYNEKYSGEGQLCKQCHQLKLLKTENAQYREALSKIEEIVTRKYFMTGRLSEIHDVLEMLKNAGFQYDQKKTE